jgi:DAK2 domain fusion protein YloV
VNNETIDGLHWGKMIAVASQYLEARKAVVDALNVFPVPDGDTGTNMSLTMQAANSAMLRENSSHFGVKAEAMAQGALLGARGNSGVITSQILAGIASACKQAEVLDGKLLCDALQKGVEAAYAAVMKPVEGTILTVAKASAQGASVAFAEGKTDIESILAAARQAALEALALTPTMLPILKQAGVVDAGGQGYLYILEGFIACLRGEALEPSAEMVQATEPVLALDADIEDMTVVDEYTPGEIQFAYCTEFVVKDENASIDLEQIREYLKTIGDCVLVVGNPSICKVHVHTNEPGNALNFVTPMGTLHKMKIDNMKEEAQKKAKEEAKKIGVISVALGSGIEEIFKSLGVHKIITGGQTMNPSTQDFVAAINNLAAREIIILPNNSNIIMAAKQAAQVTGRIVHIVPTKTIPQGIGAMLALNEEDTGAENARRMEQAASRITTLEVTFAVRDANYEEHQITKGETLGLVNDKLALTAASPEEAVTKLFEAYLKEEDELVTIYYGADVSKEDAEALAERLAQQYDWVDIEVHSGNQPLYFYIISIE